jgi:tetratricopeptide (TPR) repeat protein
MARRKKNQKKSDETLVDIVEVRDQAQSFMDKNRNLVFGVLVGAVVIFGGIFAYNNFVVKPKAQEAAGQMMQAQIQFDRDSFALALTNPGGGKSGFLDIIDNYGGTNAGNLALYYAGICYLNLGQYEAAIDYLKDHSPSGEITPVMRNGAIGDAYSELNDFGNAMTYYKKAVGAGDNEVLTAYYLKKVGLLNERNGDFAAAKEAFQRIKDEFPTSPYGRDIDKYLARVAAKG